MKAVIRNFVERDEVVQAVTLLKCLVSPHDGAALLAVLRSPVCGADDVELARFAALVKATPGLAWSWRSHDVLEHLDPAARASVPHVSRTLAGLAALAQRACRLPADEALRLVLSDPARTPELPWHPRLLEIHAASHEGVQRIANLEKLVARATELSRRDGLTLPRVVEELERELSGQAQGESPLADEKVDAVRLMTIHQAKGLEFPIVVLPDLARPERAAHGRGVRWGQGMVGLSLKAGRNLAALVLDTEARRHEEAELRRLLYVAMTRAQDRLVLLHGRRARGGSWLLDALFEHWAYDPDGAGGPLLDGAVIHEVVAVPEEAAAGVEREPLAAIAEAVLAGDASRARLATMREPPLASVTGSRELLHESRLSREAVPADAGVEVGGGEVGSPLVAAPDLSPDADAAGAGVPARAAGIAVHLALEQWDLKDAVSLRELAGRAAMLAAAETGDDREEVERHVRALLDAMPGSSAVATLSRGRVLARELPFLMERDGVPWQGFIDLVLELDGRPWVVDWKTDRELVPERHRAQLELYAEAVRRWRGAAERPGMALVHVATGRWVPLDEPG